MSTADAHQGPDWLGLPRRTALVLLVTVAVISGISAIGLALLWINGADSGIPLEVAKGCIQVLTVAVFGSAAAIAVKVLEEQRAARRREMEEQRAEERREGEFLSQVMNKTITSYNVVKHTRRLLDAESRGAEGRKLGIDAYDSYLTILDVQQLEFESLKRVAPICERRIRVNLDLDGQGAVRTKPFDQHFRDIEDYLRELGKEYQKSRHRVRETGVVSLATLPRLQSFIEETDKFRKSASESVDEIVTAIQGELLESRAASRRPAMRPGMAAT
jgi:hypothetical protein